MLIKFSDLDVFNFFTGKNCSITILLLATLVSCIAAGVAPVPVPLPRRRRHEKLAQSGVIDSDVAPVPDRDERYVNHFWLILFKMLRDNVHLCNDVLVLCVEIADALLL